MKYPKRTRPIFAYPDALALAWEGGYSHSDEFRVMAKSWEGSCYYSSSNLREWSEWASESWSEDLTESSISLAGRFYGP